MDSSQSSSKIKMLKLPPIQLSLSPNSRNNNFSYYKPISSYTKKNSFSDNSHTLNSSISYKPKHTYSNKGIYSFSSEDKLEFKSKAESYVNSLLQDNDNDIYNVSHSSPLGNELIKKDNYSSLIDPLEIIKEKYVTVHYKEQKEANTQKKKAFKEIVSNYSIDSNAYRQVAPHGVSPKRDELGILKEEFQNSRRALKPFCFARGKLKPINNRRKILNPDNSNYEETRFYLKKIFKPDFDLRMQKSINLANDYLKEMTKRQEETNKQKDLINQIE